jgi:hypothetical protein
VNISQNQIRKMNPTDLLEQIITAAGEQMEQADLYPPATLHRQDTAEVTTSPLGAG